MHGRVALVTGAGRGIGLGMAQALAHYGAAVAIQDIDVAVADAEAAALRSRGASAIALGGDIGDLELPRMLVDQTLAQLQGLHILINNAAIQTSRYWMEETPATMLEAYRANVLATLLLCQLCVPIFRQQKWGRIINLGSIQQLGGNAHMLPYSMSKASVNHLTKALSRDLAKDGITVNCIAPGWFDTYRNRDHLKTEDDKQKAGKSAPVGRLGTPADTAGLTVLLCSDAGAYITGQALHVDGGMSAR